MVLHGKLCGRVGRRRSFTTKAPLSLTQRGFLSFLDTESIFAARTSAVMEHCLRENHLVELEELFVSTARLIANPVAHKLKADAIDDLVARVREKS